jgi:hypothetical protein
MLINDIETLVAILWQRLKAAKKLDVTQGEETITDNFVLDLAILNSVNSKIIKTPKNKESCQGTDWEWWIGSHRHGWLRYAVQAKKLDLKTERYMKLNHKIGKSPNQKNQHDILETYARINEAIPLYAFYNFIDLSNYQPYWQCTLPIDAPQLGITVTPLKNVIHAIANHSKRSFQQIHSLNETLPIRCLAHCPDFSPRLSRNGRLFIPKFETNARVYKTEEVFFLKENGPDEIDNYPSELYNSDQELYPHRILVMNTGEFDS